MLSPATAETAPTAPEAGATIEVPSSAIASSATVALAAASRCVASVVCADATESFPPLTPDRFGVLGRVQRRRRSGLTVLCLLQVSLGQAVVLRSEYLAPGDVLTRVHLHRRDRPRLAEAERVHVSRHNLAAERHRAGDQAPVGQHARRQPGDGDQHGHDHLPRPGGLARARHLAHAWPTPVSSAAFMPRTRSRGLITAPPGGAAGTSAPRRVAGKLLIPGAGTVKLSW